MAGLGYLPPRPSSSSASSATSTATSTAAYPQVGPGSSSFSSSVEVASKLRLLKGKLTPRGTHVQHEHHHQIGGVDTNNTAASVNAAAADGATNVDDDHVSGIPDASALEAYVKSFTTQYPLLPPLAAAFPYPSSSSSSQAHTADQQWSSAAEVLKALGGLEPDVLSRVVTSITAAVAAMNPIAATSSTPTTTTTTTTSADHVSSLSASAAPTTAVSNNGPLSHAQYPSVPISSMPQSTSTSTTSTSTSAAPPPSSNPSLVPPLSFPLPPAAPPPLSQRDLMEAFYPSTATPRLPNLGSATITTTTTPSSSSIPSDNGAPLAPVPVPVPAASFPPSSSSFSSFSSLSSSLSPPLAAVVADSHVSYIDHLPLCDVCSTAVAEFTCEVGNRGPDGSLHRGCGLNLCAEDWDRVHDVDFMRSHTAIPVAALPRATTTSTSTSTIDEAAGAPNAAAPAAVAVAGTHKAPVSSSRGSRTQQQQQQQLRDQGRPSSAARARRPATASTSSTRAQCQHHHHDPQYLQQFQLQQQQQRKLQQQQQQGGSSSSSSWGRGSWTNDKVGALREAMAKEAALQQRQAAQLMRVQQLRRLG